MSTQFSGPWLPWFHGDFLRATQGWTLLERGAYFMLLGASWEMGALPNDPRRLASIIGAQLEEFGELWKLVGTKFEITEQGLVNHRLELHRTKQAARSEKARQSAEARWQGKTESETDAKAHANGDANGSADAMLERMRSECSSDPDPDLRSQNTEPKHSRAGARAAASDRKQPKVRRPNDFTLTDGRRARILAKLPDADPEALFEAFTAHHDAQGSTFASWDRALDTWLSNAPQFGYRQRVNAAAERSSSEEAPHGRAGSGLPYAN
jgi:uncharacterized protein YdaU (DUF1376 family)